MFRQIHQNLFKKIDTFTVLQFFDGLREDLADGAGELFNVVDPDLMMAIHEAEALEVFRASQEESVHENALGAHLRDGVGGVIDCRTALVGCAEWVLLTSEKARRVVRARIRQDD